MKKITINKEGVIFGKCTPDVQEALRGCDDVRLYDIDLRLISLESSRFDCAGRAYVGYTELKKLSDESWPDVATCRVVNHYGSAFYGTYSEIERSGQSHFVGVGRGRWLDNLQSEAGVYDTTNWQNSAEYRIIEPKLIDLCATDIKQGDVVRDPDWDEFDFEPLGMRNNVPLINDVTYTFQRLRLEGWQIISFGDKDWRAFSKVGE